MFLLCFTVKCNKRLGSTCTEDVPTTTTETPSVNPGSQGQLGNGTIADINAGFQNLHDGLQNINKNIGEMGGKLEGMDKKMGEIGGALNSIEGKIGGGLQAVEGKMDGGLQNIEEALLNVNENLQLLMEKLEAQEDHDNGGDTGTEGQVGSDHGAPNPDWWSEPNFPLGRR